MKKGTFYSICMFSFVFITLVVTKYAYLPLQFLKHQQLIQSINSLPQPNILLEQSPYFDTHKVLNNRQKAIELLKKDGFYSVRFYTPDGIKLTGFLRFKSPHQGTIICCEGYHAGTRFDAAALSALIPDNYNILYFNQRGCYPSQGKSWKNLWFFGFYQYQDIIGALQFVETLSNKPIILWGTCAGAFNAAHALVKLKQQNISYPIKGLIFDSGWACVSDTANNFTKNMIRKVMGVPRLSKPESLIEKITGRFLTLLRKILFLDYCFIAYDEQTNLLNKINTIEIPILFIHCQNDAIASYEQVQQLINQTPHAFSWIVEESTHSMIHIKQKSQYQQILTKFLDYIHYT